MRTEAERTVAGQRVSPVIPSARLSNAPGVSDLSRRDERLLGRYFFFFPFLSYLFFLSVHFFFFFSFFFFLFLFSPFFPLPFFFISVFSPGLSLFFLSFPELGVSEKGGYQACSFSSLSPLQVLSFEKNCFGRQRMVTVCTRHDREETRQTSDYYYCNSTRETLNINTKSTNNKIHPQELEEIFSLYKCHK